MSGVDMKRMREGHEEQQKGGDFVTFDPGETLIYIHPPCRDGDEWEPTSGRCYIPVTVHYGIGKNKGMAVSLDTEKNAFLEHPWIKAILKKKKVRITGDCPVAAALSDGTLTDDDADEARPQTRFLWGVTVLKKRAKSTDPWNDVGNPKPSVAFVGKQLFDAFMSIFFDQDGDITNPMGAILVKVKREGEKRTTKYSAVADPGSIRTPFKLPKSLRLALKKATEPEGDCDLFRIAANLVKGTAEVQAMLAGSKVDTSAEDFDDDEAETPPKKAPKKAPKPPADEEDDEDLDDEEEAPAKPAKKAPAKPTKSKPADDDDEEDDEEEEAAQPKKSSKKAPVKPADDEDEDDEDLDDNEDEDEDEDEAPPAKPSKKAESKPAKKAPVKPADEEDDEDLDDDDDDPPPPKKAKTASAKPEKGKKPAKDDDDDDIDDLEAALDELDDGDDEEETPPAKPKKGKK
jgi:hypothetical protein